MAFVFPRPSFSELTSHYDDYGRDYYSNPKVIDYFFSSHKVERELRYLLRVAPKGRLLDVGCSMGSFVEAATKHGYQASGIDICSPAIQIGKARGLPVTCADLFSYNEVGKFDVITMWATLEHVPNPNDFMVRIREMLQPNGIFIASVPNFGSLTIHITGSKNCYICRDHLNYWTAKGFENYFRQQGFVPEGLTTFGFDPITIIRDLRGRTGPVQGTKMASEQSISHKLKSHFLVRLGLRSAEAILDIFHAGDAVMLAGRKAG
jgi:2-polyprenyl-3-methyl-5-hydroxy-6-metoxy-1,4-benzoquinol methylase